MNAKVAAVPAPIEEPTTTAIVEQGAFDDYDRAGAGFEGMTPEDFAIPFLTVLQKGSPQVDDASSSRIDEARAGMLYDTVSGRLFDGKKGVLLVPCYYRRVYLRWGPRDSGGGFRGEVTVDEVAKMRAAGRIKELDGRLYAPLDDGSVSDKRSDRFADTRNMYCLMIDEPGQTFTPILLSITSTQIKKSRAIMAQLDAYRERDPATGEVRRIAMFRNLIRITTIPEANDKGTWFGMKFERVGTTRQALAGGFFKQVDEAAMHFFDSIKAGTIATSSYDAVAAHSSAASDGGGGGGGADDAF